MENKESIKEEKKEVKIKKKVTKRKKEIADELVNKMIKMYFNEETLEKALNKDLKKRDVVQEYKKEEIGDKLRESIYIKECNKLSRKHEKTLTEEDTITILKNVLCRKNYTLTKLTLNKTPINEKEVCFFIKKTENN